MLARGFLWPTNLAAVPVCEVHHHRERYNLHLYLGIKRSNRHKSNRNTHINERQFARVRFFKSVFCSLKKSSQ
ncbi:unnamed protein product [Gongylonema pulchrum]|uniref:Secreted protein n=1 Tax=Gongylonema pulchrum TaxID=637853 RepID=A0A183EV34_9BILA|nr:unnamed protein product [Gongylonema pulchrum]